MGLRVDARKDKRADEIVRIQQNLSTFLACAPTHQNVATFVGIALQGYFHKAKRPIDGDGRFQACVSLQIIVSIFWLVGFERTVVGEENSSSIFRANGAYHDFTSSSVGVCPPGK